jgi:hypothetical protein
MSAEAVVWLERDYDLWDRWPPSPMKDMPGVDAWVVRPNVWHEGVMVGCVYGPIFQIKDDHGHPACSLCEGP